MTTKSVVFAIAALALSITACGASSTPAATPTPQAPTATAPSTPAASSTAASARAPADSKTPAAGTCETASGDTGTVKLPPDFVPQPRCLIITSAQKLSITNSSGQSLNVKLGDRSATIADGATYAFPESVGSFLEPGVHYLHFTAASAADIWVDAQCTGPGGTDCRTP